MYCYGKSFILLFREEEILYVPKCSPQKCSFHTRNQEAITLLYLFAQDVDSEKQTIESATFVYARESSFDP